MVDKKGSVTDSYQVNMQALRDRLESFSVAEEGRKFASIVIRLPKQDPVGWGKWVTIMGTYIRIADPDAHVSDDEVDGILGLIHNSWGDLEEWMGIVHSFSPESREIHAKFSGVKEQLDYAESRWDKIIAIDCFIGTVHKREPFALPVLCGVQGVEHHVALGVLTKYITDCLEEERA